MAEDQLLHTHTHYYEDVFLLCVRLQFDGEQLQLEGHAKSLSLHCPHLNISISPTNLKRAVEVAVSMYDVCSISRMKCGDYPLFEVDFGNARSLHCLLKDSESGELPVRIQKQLVHEMRSKHFPKQPPTVATKLLLLSPNVANNDPLLRQVTLTNLQELLGVYSRKRSFNYGALMRYFQKEKSREVPPLAILLKELREVCHWCTLGIHLGIDRCELYRIQAQFGVHIDGLAAMLDAWMKTGHATWISLITSLKISGFGSLAKRLAITYDIPSLDSPTHMKGKNEDEHFEIKTKLCLSVQEHDSEMMYLQDCVTFAEKKESQLSASLEDIRENLKDVKSHLTHLFSQKEILHTTLKTKQHHHSYLLLHQATSDDIILKEMIQEIELTIGDVKNQIQMLQQEIQNCNQKEEALRNELEQKNVELRKLKETLCEMKVKNAQLSAELESERRILELTVQAKLAQGQSDQKVQEDLRQHIVLLQEMLTSKLNSKEHKSTEPHLVKALKELHISYGKMNGSISPSPSPSVCDDDKGVLRKQRVSSSENPPVPPRPPHLMRPKSLPITTTSTDAIQSGRSSSLTSSRSFSLDTSDKYPSILKLLDSGGKPWYYRNIDEQDAEKILTSQMTSCAGTYLVYRAKDKTLDYLSVLGQTQVYHYPVYSGKNYSVYLSKKKQFPTIDALIEHYSQPSAELPFPLTTPCCKSELIRRVDVKPGSLFVQEVIEEGAQSQVFAGVFNRHQAIVAKTRKEGSSLSVYNFLSEAVVMRSLQHNNIHQFISITLMETGQLCILSEPVHQLNMKDYLEKVTKSGQTLPEQTIFSYASQIARGMCYLESQRCLYRNLACKNIMLARGSHHRHLLKLSNFSRACFSPSGTMTSRLFNILLRWTAPELLFDGTCSSKSDVWSYGITLWEIITYGSKPYKEYGSEDVKEMVRQGYRMKLNGLSLPQSVSSLIRECWSQKPEDRPSFKNISKRLKLIQDGSYSSFPYNNQ